MYGLCQALRQDQRCGDVRVCSRGIEINADFFAGNSMANIYGSKVDHDFSFESADRILINISTIIDRATVDVILIRMPQPVDVIFLRSLEQVVVPEMIINRPEGVIETASKEFLLHIPHLCAEPVLREHVDDAFRQSQEKEIVLKPLYSYGGKGLIRLSNNDGWIGNQRYDLHDMFELLDDSMFPMLSNPFLQNVAQGDKRTIIVNQKILGSTIRYPAPGSWMCNVAQGGHAEIATMDAEEIEMEKELTPMLIKRGIVMYAMDTLMGDDGRRVLSEINTLSIGGLVPLEEMSGKPVLTDAAKHLLDYISEISR
jgi:glutathione synthase